MHTFEIAEAARFPDELTAVVVPDDGRRIRFSESVENYYGTELPLMGLFVSEYGTGLEVNYLSNPGLICMRAVVTFGVHVLKDKITHLDIVAQELDLPFMRLIIPDTYPTINNTLDERDPFYVQWVDNNPLKDLYHQSVLLERTSNQAKFSLA